ncbi:CPBP family intramembrane glutamic endopeptidase [Mycolicibacterium fallax]|uniref:CPBP family intramembrane glutamic endopeptidase n=1 Tax=Mycolicibacterium fallax TaxID=1793 RepID=UPI00138CD657|nr:CPBP family intramembrane glutamic endopeptidase [Mycolicibacterium fallax]BBY99337.1 CAAX amino protease [Mycolicibacterium fallax]
MNRRALRTELAIVLAVTFGLSAFTATLTLIDFWLRGLAEQRVALNPRRSYFDLIDFGMQLAGILQLLAWGALALYLLWRTGTTLRRIGLGRFRPGPDLLGGLGLAALIGLPGLGLYLAARSLGLAAEVVPAEIGSSWWRIPTLILAAVANSWAEEVVVVGYLLTRLDQLGVRPGRALLASAALRGAYHLYQGIGAGLGNLAMGLIFGYVWRRTGRLWPLIVAHAVIDIVAFVGYALLAGRLDWLR